MTQINPVGTAAAAGTGAPTGSGATGSSASTQNNPLLDKNAFLKLMMVQLQHQDPLQPSDPTQYLSQLAQYTTLEQEMNIASSTATTANEQNTAAAVALIGHSVTYTDANGNPQTGTATSVAFTSSGPTLTVGGVSGISLANVTSVA
jgi:flagellar basal-body rod modification protein FlgD